MCAQKKNTLTHTQSLFPSSGHGPLADACRPSLMIHGFAGCCGVVLSHWAEESLRAIKAQRAGHAAGAAALKQALQALALQTSTRRGKEAGADHIGSVGKVIKTPECPHKLPNLMKCTLSKICAAFYLVGHLSLLVPHPHQIFQLN